MSEVLAFIDSVTKQANELAARGTSDELLAFINYVAAEQPRLLNQMSQTSADLERVKDEFAADGERLGEVASCMELLHDEQLYVRDEVQRLRVEIDNRNTHEGWGDLKHLHVHIAVLACAAEYNGLHEAQFKEQVEAAKAAAAELQVALASKQEVVERLEREELKKQDVGACLDDLRNAMSISTHQAFVSIECLDRS